MIPHDGMRLKSIEVEGLFGIYNHIIHLNLDKRITLLHGPNGVGKTHILGMVNALIEKNTSFFRQIPCDRFRLNFTEGFLELIINSADMPSRIILDSDGKMKKLRLVILRMLFLGI